MDRVKKARKTTRTILDRTLNELEVELERDDPRKDEVSEKLEYLGLKCGECRGLDQKVLDLLLDKNCTDKVYEEEVLAQDEYQCRVRRMMNRCDRVLEPPSVAQDLPPSSHQQCPRTPESHNKRTYRLPKIELKKFNGELTEWLGWWSQFRKIHQDDELDPSDKFQYLLQSMTIGSRARDLVESYPQTGENYPKVITALKDRFGKDDLLVEVYVRELLKLVIENVNTKEKKLCKMYDKLESHLRALETLGVTSDNSAAILFPMVESSIPDDILRAWLRSPLSTQHLHDDRKTKLDFLMEFLKSEIQGEERSTLAKSGFGASCKSHETKKTTKSSYDEDVPTTSGFFVSTTSSCCFCGKNHPSPDCYTAQTMTLEEKRNKVRENKCCYTCLRHGHQSKKCKTFVRCAVCTQKHPVIMCPELEKRKPDATKNTNVAASTTATMSNQSCSRDVLMQTLVVKVRDGGGGADRVVRLLFDTGSQQSYVLSSSAEELNLVPLERKELRKTLFGGVVTSPKIHTKYKLQLESLDGRGRYEVTAWNEDSICGRISRIPRGGWLRQLEKKKIQLSDFASENCDIEILVGSDHYGQLLTGRILQLDRGLTAIETRLGWCVSGPSPIYSPVEESYAMMVTSLMVNQASPSDLWSLETIGIHDPSEHKSKAEKENETKIHFQKTVTRNEDGRYSVSLPWTTLDQSIPSNKDCAVKRLESATAKLISTDMVGGYDQVFRAWEDEGIIEEVLEEDDNVKCHYLPHRPVFKPDSLTTPIRPVFDASSKTRRNPSLNECLEKGPNLMELIPSILIRFREKKIGVISDIRKAFLQIEVQKEDRDFLRFLWWSDTVSKKMKILRHKRVVFGVNCSPFLLAAVIEHHLAQVSPCDREIAMKLLRSLYVDNCVASVDTFEELEFFRSSCTRLMADAKMELRSWEWGKGRSSGVDSLSGCGLEDDFATTQAPWPITSVLGMKWDKNDDSLMCDIKEEKTDKVTKRTVLSHVQRIFDPMGFYVPTLLVPKVQLQELWNEKTGWDEEVNEFQRSKFCGWYKEVPFLREIKIPRNMTGGNTDRRTWQLHVFGDASKVAYATAVFLRAGDEDHVSVQLVQAKSRVAPLKKTSIPRLELLACTIGARLAVSVMEALQFEGPVTYWSDSTTALAWIKRNDEWGTFVGNRVKEICQLSDSKRWRHVPGHLNPADLPSRGCSPSELVESRWWEGPKWLRYSEETWPHAEQLVDEDEIAKEKKKSATTTCMVSTTAEVPWYMRRFSNYHSCVRMVAWMRRWIPRPGGRIVGALTVAELDNAEMKLFKLVQQQSFPDANQGVICGLRVLKCDEDGLYRVKTKLMYRDDSKDFRLPVLLPSSHPWVDLLIQQTHLEHGHTGIQCLLGKIREKCWIQHGRRAARKVVGRCVICRRFASKCPVTPSAPLPENRVRDAKVFQVTGVDLAGPLFLRNKTKCWIVLFTCAVYRCVHFELVTSLSTDCFLLALKRFVDRRGRPEVIYSDNGKNFVGTENLFAELDWEEIERESLMKRIRWVFIPPTAAWWGGWWERLIRMMKDLVRRIVGRSKLDWEELSTVVVQVEAIMNGRPLTYLSEDPEDLVPLSPSSFLQDLSENGVPDVDQVGGSELRRRYRYRQQVLQEFRSRFRKEYLAQLVQKGKDKNQKMISVGDIVLVGTDNKKRMDWPMGKVLELMPSRDGHVRVAKVKTSTAVLTRPIQRLFPLEVSSVAQLCLSST